MKPFDKEIRVERFDNIGIFVFVVGFPKEGESIVFVMQDGDIPVFTIVTDCYSYNGYNHTTKVLQDNGIKQIDAFVWTHPDQDHSIGIVDMLTTFDTGKQSKVFVPSTFNGGQDYTVCDDAAKAIGFLMQEYNKDRLYNLHFVSVNTGEQPRSLYRINVIESTTGHEINIALKFLAPNSALIERRDGMAKDFNLNDLSLVYVWSLNGFNYLFTGDLINQSVQFIDADDLINTNFIKIPHHGSDSSAKLIKLLCQNELNVASSVSTVSTQNNDPKDFILQKYKSFSNKVCCTGYGDNNYGCVKTVFDINGVLKKEPELFGNAYMFH